MYHPGAQVPGFRWICSRAVREHSSNDAVNEHAQVELLLFFLAAPLQLDPRVSLPGLRRERSVSVLDLQPQVGTAEVEQRCCRYFEPFLYSLNKLVKQTPPNTVFRGCFIDGGNLQPGQIPAEDNIKKLRNKVGGWSNRLQLFDHLDELASGKNPTKTVHIVPYVW
jgi:hypothetical protein